MYILKAVINLFFYVKFQLFNSALGVVACNIYAAGEVRLP